MAVVLTSDATGQSLRPVAPHATADLPDGPCRALHVNDDGVVTVAIIARDDDPNSTPVLWTISGPDEVRVSCRAVRVTGTTAVSIVAIY